VKKVKRQEVDFVMGRGKKLSKGFTAYDRNSDINFRRAALG
jgi:hypothetical protein